MEAKTKIKKIFAVVRVILVILLVIGVAFLGVENHEMHEILNQEAQSSNDFWRLKMAIAQCYLSEQQNLFSDNTELYQKILYSNDCDADLDKVKWVATKIDLYKDGQYNYKGNIHVWFEEPIEILITDSQITKIIEEQLTKNYTEQFFTDTINLQMYYSMTDEVFVVETIY